MSAGLSLAVSLDMEWMDWVHPQDRDTVRAAWRRTKVEMVPFEARFRLLDSDGHCRALQVREAARIDALSPDQAPALTEPQFRALVANLSGMVFRCRAEPPWQMDFVSEGVERLTGYPPSYFLRDAHPFRELMVDDDVPRVVAELNAQIGAGLQTHVEYRLRRRDGCVIWVEARARVSEDDPSLFEGTVMDVDARKRAQDASVEAGRRLELFRHLAESSLELVALVDLDQRLRYLNPAGRRAIGLTHDADVTGLRLRDLLYESDRPLLHQELLRALSRGGSYRGDLDMPHRVTGERVPLDCYLFAIKDPTSGETFAYGTVSRLMAEAQASERALVASEARLRDSEALARLTMEQVPTILWRSTADGQISFVSGGAEKYLGRSPQDLLDERWMALAHPDDQQRMRSARAQSLRTGEAYDQRVRFLDGAGQYRWFRISANAHRDEQGRIVAWYGAATDIEEVVQAQARAEQAARAKSAFLSTMSHEIRTPLNAVLGFADLLCDTELGAQQREFVSSIRASGDHLLGVINAILDFSRLESGSFALDYGSCEVHALVESALDLVASQAAQKHLELIHDVAPEVPAFIHADAARLRQVLVNLLGNAVKFTAAGEVSLTVEAALLDADHTALEFVIRDTGIGISADKLDRLFRDFSQVDGSVTRRYGGSGLGLAISRRLIEAHGGTIQVSSRQGQGSEFRVRLPLRLAQGPGVAPERSLERLRHRRVLIVDDHRSQLDPLGRQLRAWGLQPICTQDPTQASTLLDQAQARGEPISLAILDLQMPALDGLSLARMLGASRHLPTILLSNLNTPTEQISEARSEVSAVLTKPVHRVALRNAIAEALDAMPAPVAVSSAMAQVRMPAMRLLLAEDNAVNRKLAQLLLHKLGYEKVDVAADGLEALEAAMAREYDVVLMDVEMPNLDGLHATRRIRAGVSAARQPQIIAMTANAMAQDREVCIGAGMDDYVAKPVDLPALRQALLSAAQRRGIQIPQRELEKRSAREVAALRERSIAEQVLAGGGEMGALMRRVDWAQTPLGPVYTWPQSLRTALSILLSQKHPFFLWWGPELVQFYNDAYRPMLGRTKHPSALGQRGRECWTEIWDSISGLIDAAFQRGQGSMVERGLLCLDRNGLLEEAYFSYGFSPIRDESGGVGGVLVAVTENTQDVLATRRSSLLLELDEAVLSDPRAAWANYRRLMESCCHDLPFTLVYRLNPAGNQAQLLAVSGLPEDGVLAPRTPSVDADPWGLFSPGPAQRTAPVGMPVLPPWPEPPREAMVVPIGSWGVLVAGLSARLIVDEAYQRFVSRFAHRLQGLKESPPAQ